MSARLGAICALLVSGCTSYVDVKTQLVSQATRAVDSIETSAIQRALLIDEWNMLERQRLDNAFDLDVRQQKELDPEWVIDHRKAYAIGLDAIHREQAAREHSVRIDQENAALAREALTLLQRFHNFESGHIFKGKGND